MTSAAQLRPDSPRSRPGHAPKSWMLLGGYTANLPRLVIEIRNIARARRTSRLFAAFPTPTELRIWSEKSGLFPASTAVICSRRASGSVRVG